MMLIILHGLASGVPRRCSQSRSVVMDGWKASGKAVITHLKLVSGKSIPSLVDFDSGVGTPLAEVGFDCRSRCLGRFVEPSRISPFEIVEDCLLEP